MPAFVSSPSPSRSSSALIVGRTAAVDECIAFLRSSRIVGRIAVSIAALPVILPVNYLAFDDAVWVGAPGGRVAPSLSVSGRLWHSKLDGFDAVRIVGLERALAARRRARSHPIAANSRW